MERAILKEIGQNSSQQISQDKVTPLSAASSTKNDDVHQLNHSFEKENYLSVIETHPKLLNENTAEHQLEMLGCGTSTPKMVKDPNGTDTNQKFEDYIVPISRHLNLNESKPLNDTLGCLAKNFGSMGFVDKHSSRADITFSDDEDFEECRSFNDTSNNFHKTFDGAIIKTEHISNLDFGQPIDEALSVKVCDMNKTAEIIVADRIFNTTVDINNVSTVSSSAPCDLNVTVDVSCTRENILNKTTKLLSELSHEQIGLTEFGDAGWTKSYENTEESFETKVPTVSNFRADSLEPEIQNPPKIIQADDEPMEIDEIKKDILPVLNNVASTENSSQNDFNTIESQDIEFKFPSVPISQIRSSLNNAFNPFEGPIVDAVEGGSFEDEFKSASEFQFSGSDFDYLQQFGNSQTEEDIRRDSVLLKFDPLFKQSVLIQHSASTVSCLPIPLEEDEYFPSLNSDILDKINEDRVNPFDGHSTKEENNSIESEVDSVVESDSSIVKKYTIPAAHNDVLNEMKDHILETTEYNGNSLNHNNQFDCGSNEMNESQDSQQQGFKMDELENKIKTEILKSEDIEKKLKDSEIREETLLKRITEKDKTISKMSGVVEAYEKAIAELIAEKEQLVQSYEKKCSDLKMDGEMNAQHLGSLETTFSDLHAKYERTKQVAAELKEREDKLLVEKKQNAENLKMQEMRYEKMKTHAMAQLETANNKLAELTRNHSADLTKLRAQLKKEEISRASTTEQLLQKSKENEELVKICDELINGGQTS